MHFFSEFAVCSKLSLKDRQTDRRFNCSKYQVFEQIQLVFSGNSIFMQFFSEFAVCLKLSLKDRQTDRQTFQIRFELVACSIKCAACAIKFPACSKPL